MIEALLGVGDDVRKMLGADDHGDARRTALDREPMTLPADTGVNMQQLETAGPQPSHQEVRIVVEPFDRHAETGGPLQQGPAARAHGTGQGHVVAAPPLSCQGQHMLPDAGRLEAVGRKAETRRHDPRPSGHRGCAGRVGRRHGTVE